MLIFSLVISFPTITITINTIFTILISIIPRLDRKQVMILFTYVFQDVYDICINA